jgi:hypothetical protein
MSSSTLFIFSLLFFFSLDSWSTIHLFYSFNPLLIQFSTFKNIFLFSCSPVLLPGSTFSCCTILLFYCLTILRISCFTVFPFICSMFSSNYINLFYFSLVLLVVLFICLSPALFFPVLLIFRSIVLLFYSCFCSIFLSGAPVYCSGHYHVPTELLFYFSTLLFVNYTKIHLIVLVFCL